LTCNKKPFSSITELHKVCIHLRAQRREGKNRYVAPYCRQELQDDNAISAHWDP